MERAPRPGTGELALSSSWGAVGGLVVRFLFSMLYMLLLSSCVFGYCMVGVTRAAISVTVGRL